MPPLNILLKPASSACNLRCSYCFYADEASIRAVPSYGMMPEAVSHALIEKAAGAAEGSVAFLFQGGEPTLAGLDFFRETVALEKKHRKLGVAIHNAIQTNGLSLNEDWARFLKEEHFLVGLSLDGPPELHDRNRRDNRGKGTCDRVVKAAKLLDRFGVEYNILCVLTGQNARSIQRIHNFYKKQGFRYLQFIPCLEPLGQERGGEGYHLSPADYGDFLLRVFDLWLQDLRKGDYVSIRHLDNWLSIMLREPPEACGSVGCCSVQFVVEGDGGVYPCDFYVLDEWRLGRVGEQSFAQMAQSDAARRFVEASRSIPEACKACPVYPVCRNGCRRDRLVTTEGIIDRNYYCEAYKRFFGERQEELREALGLILKLRRRYQS